MADFISIGLTATITVATQATYYIIVKFPAEFAEATLGLRRVQGEFTAALNENARVLKVAEESTDIRGKAIDYLIGTSAGPSQNAILDDLYVMRGKLLGLEASREPLATRIKLIVSDYAELIELCKIFPVNLTSPLRRQVLSSTWTSRLSSEVVGRRMNEDLDRLTFDLEGRVNSLNKSLMLFRISVVLLCALLFVISGLLLWILFRRLPSYTKWRWAIVFVASLPFTRFINVTMMWLKKMADTTEEIVKSTEAAIETYRRDEMRYPL